MNSPRRHAHAAHLPAVLRAHSPEDLMAFVPLALGFAPAESVVIIAVGARGPHARVDLPSVVEAEEVGRQLAHTYVCHGVERVAVVGCSGRPETLDPVLLTIAGWLDRSHVRVVAVLATGAGHGRALSDDPGDPGEPFTFDATSHAFRARAVFEGHVVHASREAVVAQVARDPRAVRILERERSVRAHGHGWQPSPDPAAEVAVRVQMLRDAFGRDVWSGEQGGHWMAEALELLAAPGGGIERWLLRDREEIARQLGHWCRVLQACPDDELVPVATVVAHQAWASGNGALAWSALDRVDAVHRRPVASDAWRALNLVRSFLVTARTPLGPEQTARRTPAPGTSDRRSSPEDG